MPRTRVAAQPPTAAMSVPSAMAAAQTSSGISRASVSTYAPLYPSSGTGSPLRTAATDAPRWSICVPESLK